MESVANAVCKLSLSALKWDLCTFIWLYYALNALPKALEYFYGEIISSVFKTFYV